MQIYWFMNDAAKKTHRYFPRLPCFSPTPWIRMDRGYLEVSTRFFSLQLSTYPVKGRRFNPIFIWEDLQGDLQVDFVLVLFERGYKLMLGFPDVYRYKRGPHIDWRWNHTPIKKTSPSTPCSQVVDQHASKTLLLSSSRTEDTKQD